jgi:hypothetical protein
MTIVRTPMLGLAMAAATIAMTDDASACSEVVPAIVLPRSTPAPANAHVWVQGLELSLFDGASFVVVPSDDASSPVDLDMRTWTTSMVWELVPRARLREGARYEVWGVPRGKKPKPPILLGTFRTNMDDDKTPPSAPKLTRSEERTPLGSCSTWIAIEGTPGSDSSGETMHAVWMSDPEGRLAYHEPPAQVLMWTDREAALHAWFKHKGKRRIGVRAVDVAGNVSDAAEIDVQ